MVNPVPIPQVKWQHISSEWIEPLPLSQGKNSIMTVIDRATRQVHLVATTITSTGEQIALQLLDSVFKYHGLPTSISSDRDRRLMSKIWQATLQHLGIIHKKTMSFYPQGNGLAE